MPPNQQRKAARVKPLTAGGSREGPGLWSMEVAHAEMAEVEVASAGEDGEEAEGEAYAEADEVDGFHDYFWVRLRGLGFG